MIPVASEIGVSQEIDNSKIKRLRTHVKCEKKIYIRKNWKCNSEY
jgi:hypothetical protein